MIHFVTTSVLIVAPSHNYAFWAIASAHLSEGLSQDEVGGLLDVLKTRIEKL